MISIICVTNNEEVLNTYLLPSLKRQTVQDYDLVLVNAKEFNLDSAAKALNLGAEKAKGDLLVFCHQDIEFLEDDALEKIEAFAKGNEFGIAGVAGIKKEDRLVYSTVIHGPKRQQAGQRNEGILKVAALDECLLVIKKKNFAGFDDLGATWHFYAVDYAYQSQKRGEKVLAFPLPIYHLSPGWSLDSSYFKTLKVIASKYPEKETILTCIDAFPNGKKLNSFIRVKKLKLFIKRILGFHR